MLIRWKELITSLRIWRCAACHLQPFILQFHLVPLLQRTVLNYRKWGMWWWNNAATPELYEHTAFPVASVLQNKSLLVFRPHVEILITVLKSVSDCSATGVIKNPISVTICQTQCRCWKCVWYWSKRVSNAVILPSQWSHTVQKQVKGEPSGWDRDTIHPITRNWTINMI